MKEYEDTKSEIRALVSSFERLLSYPLILQTGISWICWVEWTRLVLINVVRKLDECSWNELSL